MTRKIKTLILFKLIFNLPANSFRFLYFYLSVLLNNLHCLSVAYNRVMEEGERPIIDQLAV